MENLEAAPIASQLLEIQLDGREVGKESVSRASRDSIGRRTVSFSDIDEHRTESFNTIGSGHHARAPRHCLQDVLDQHQADVRSLFDSMVTKHEMELIRHRTQVRSLLDDHMHHLEGVIYTAGLDGRDVLAPVSDQVSLQQTHSDGRPQNRARLGWQDSFTSLTGASLKTRRGSLPSGTTDEATTSRPLQDLFQQMQSRIYTGGILHYIAVALGLEALEAKFMGCCLKRRLPLQLRNFASKVVHSTHFEIYAAITIITNFIFIAVTADNFMERAVDLWNATPLGTDVQPAELNAPPGSYKVLDVIFACLFTVEWVFRILADELGFVVGPDWKWNFIDTIAVASSWLEISLDALDNRTFVDLSLVRVLRILRVLRGVRVVRVLLVFRELRLLLLSLTGSVMPLLWALVVLNVVTFMFGVVIQQGVASHLVSEDTFRGTDEEELEAGINGFMIETASKAALIDMFVSFPRTFLTLFKSITGGENWGVVQFQLESASKFFGIVWCIYIAIMFLGVLNVITGIFVECAVARARTDKEMALMEEMERNKERMRELMELFGQLDINSDGKVTLQEWEDFTNQREAQAAMALLDLDVRKTKEIYKMLDLNDNHEVDLEEFAVGCMQLSGMAKGVDVETLLRNSKKMLRLVSCHFNRLERKIEAYMTSQSNKVGSAMEQVEKLVSSRTLSDFRDTVTSSDTATKERREAPVSEGGADALDMVHTVLATDKGSVSKTATSRQALRRRVHKLTRLAKTHVDDARNEEVQAALAVLTRDLDAPSQWTSTMGRTLNAELDALSVRYGLCHLEAEALSTDVNSHVEVPDQMRTTVLRV